MSRETSADQSRSNETYINVISSITGSAASQVDGVVSVTYGNAKSTRGRKSKNKAIDVVIYDNKFAKIEISVNIYYGYVIPVVVCKLQEKIKQEIEKSTFYRVSSVNVNVVGIVAGH